VTDDGIPGPRSGDGPGEGGPEDPFDDTAVDDALLDVVGEGTDPVGADRDEQDLLDILGAWRDDVNSEPVPTPTADRAARGEITPGGASVSNPFEQTAQEFAGLKNLTPHEEAQTMFTILGQIGEAGNALLPQGSDNWRNKIEEVRQQALTLIEGLASLDAQIDQTAQRIAQGPGNL
jgi:hypothetical protein